MFKKSEGRHVIEESKAKPHKEGVVVGRSICDSVSQGLQKWQLPCNLEDADG